jgi:hypothetical protein
MLIHYHLVDIRAIGSGALKMKMLGYDANQTQELLPLILTSRPGKTLHRLSSFIDQKCQLECRMENINENFKIHKITIYPRPIFNQFPG